MTQLEEKKTLNICLLNIRSVTNESCHLRDLLFMDYIDIVAMSEIWLIKIQICHYSCQTPDSHVFGNNRCQDKKMVMTTASIAFLSKFYLLLEKNMNSGHSPAARRLCDKLVNSKISSKIKKNIYRKKLS